MVYASPEDGLPEDSVALAFQMRAVPKAALDTRVTVSPLQEREMRPLRYSISITLDGCCDHRAMFADEEMHRHAVEDLSRPMLFSLAG
jgi:hypothetical protein